MKMIYLCFVTMYKSSISLDRKKNYFLSHVDNQPKWGTLTMP